MRALAAEEKHKKWLKSEEVFMLKTWAHEGLTDEDITVKKMGISHSTLS